MPTASVSRQLLVRTTEVERFDRFFNNSIFLSHRNDIKHAKVDERWACPVNLSFYLPELTRCSRVFSSYFRTIVKMLPG